MLRSARTNPRIDNHPGHAIGMLPMVRRCFRWIPGKAIPWVAAGWVAWAAFPAVAATRLDLQVGRSYMDNAGTSAVFVEAVPDPRRIADSRFSWSPDASVGWIDGRDIKRFQSCRYSTHDSVWLLAGGIRLHYGDVGDWYRSLFFSFQPAIHSGRTQALSSAYEFISTLGWQGRRFTIQIRHISNGSMHEPNRGETMALIGVALNF